MRDREFRDAITRAAGAVKGMETEAKQWDRYTP